MTAAFTAALNGIYLFIIPVGIWIGSSTNDYQASVAPFIFYLIFVPVIASILMKVLYASVNAMQVGNAVEHMDQVLAEPEIPEKGTSQKPSTYDVVYDHVTFSYTEDEKMRRYNPYPLPRPRERLLRLSAHPAAVKVPLPACFLVSMMWNRGLSVSVE